MSFLSLAVLLKDPDLTTTPPVVARPFAVEGRVTLLAGPPKRGKTSTISAMVAESSRRGVRSAICQLDEPLADTVQRLVRFGAAPEHVWLSDRMDWATLAEELTAHAVQLFVLDHIGKLAEGHADFGAGSAGDGILWGRLLMPFTTLARQQHLAVVLLDQARRSDGQYSGSAAKASQVDVVVELLERDGGLEATPRGRVLIPAFRVELDQEGLPVFTSGTESQPLLLAASPTDGKALELLRLLSDAEPEGLTSAGWQKQSGFPATSYHRNRRALLRGGLALSPAETRSRRYRVTDKGEEALDLPLCHGSTTADSGSTTTPTTGQGLSLVGRSTSPADTTNHGDAWEAPTA